MRTLMYHDISSSAQREEVGFPGPLAGRYKLAPDAFEAHLDALAATGLRVGTVDAGGSLPQLLLSFDDGGGSAPLAAEALERRGWRGQFFVTTGRLGTPGFLSAEDLRELARRGHAIGGHSHTHPTYMGRLTREELDREWDVDLAVKTLLPDSHLSPKEIDERKDLFRRETQMDAMVEADGAGIHGFLAAPQGELGMITGKGCDILEPGLLAVAAL